jgi:hypothetical protein
VIVIVTFFSSSKTGIAKKPSFKLTSESSPNILELLQNRSDKLSTNENGNIVNSNLANHKPKKNNSSSTNSIIKKEINYSKKNTICNQRSAYSRSTNNNKLELNQSINRKESSDCSSSKEPVSMRLEVKKKLFLEKITDNHLNGYSNRCNQQSPRFDSLGLRLPLTPNGN